MKKWIDMLTERIGREPAIILALGFVLAMVLIISAISGNAQSVTGHPDTVQGKQGIAHLWRLTDSLQRIAQTSSNPIERVRAIDCVDWIVYRIERLPEEPRGDLWDFNEWKTRRLIDNSEVFKK